jgi:hypothetical protein
VSRGILLPTHDRDFLESFCAPWMSWPKLSYPW